MHPTPALTIARGENPFSRPNITLKSFISREILIRISEGGQAGANGFTNG
jgi:hypothetical protein